MDKYTPTPVEAWLTMLREYEARRHRLHKLAMRLQDEGCHTTAAILAASADALADKCDHIRIAVNYRTGE